jgi:uncharacterized membrane protein YfcA
MDNAHEITLAQVIAMLTGLTTLLGAVFFLTAVVSVVTGGTSLITVPVLLLCGLEPRVAVATNMLALIFLSLGGMVPFLKGEILPRERLPGLIALTLLSSALGALLLIVVPARAIPLVIAGAMLAVAVFSLLTPRAGLDRSLAGPSRVSALAGHATTFLLGVYGGFFSGGYVALLTAAYVVLFGMTFVEAIAATKVLNAFSSLVATIVFAAQGLIDWKLGLPLSAASFVGGLLGGTVARRMNNRWLRWFFLIAIIVLAAKILLWDVGRSSP